MADAYRPLPIEDYALIGDCRSAALVGRNGSIDWLCWPHFDSDACLTALLGADEHGRWALGPTDAHATSTRRYQGDTLVLETVFETADGAVAVVDFMPVEPVGHTVVRRVEGRRGRVEMSTRLNLRFEYGSVTPWLSPLEAGGGVAAVAGPTRVTVRAAVAARRDPGSVVVARTDARATEGFDRAVDRARGYLEAGADMIFPEALESADEFARFAREVDAPLLANMTEFGRGPLLPFDELAGMGYRAVLYPLTAFRSAMKAAEETLTLLRDHGTQRDHLGRMQTRAELYDLLGYDGWEARDRAYFGDRGPA